MSYLEGSSFINLLSMHYSTFFFLQISVFLEYNSVSFAVGLIINEIK